MSDSNDRSAEQSRPGRATASLEQLKNRWGAAADLGSDPVLIFVEAPSGKETWARISPGRYERVET